MAKQSTRVQGHDFPSPEVPRAYPYGIYDIFAWGKRYLLAVSESDGPPSIALDHTQMLLRVKPGTAIQMRGWMIEQWYREQIKTAVPPLLSHWEPVMEVKVMRLFVQRMKTRWGSCNLHHQGQSAQQGPRNAVPARKVVTRMALLLVL